jgi:Na+-driven multidrug efflux pump
VALNIANYQYAVNTAFCCAAITIVAQCIGANQVRQAKYYAKLLVGLEYLLMWVVIVLSVLFLRPLLSTYDVSQAARDFAYDLVISHSIVAALIYPLGFLFPAIFRAAGDVKTPLYVSTLSMWLVRIAFAYVLALDSISFFGLFSFNGLGWGMWGVWVAMLLDWAVRAAIYLIRFLSNGWMKAKRLS